MSASKAGWIDGMYFGGYAASVPILAGFTGRIDGRRGVFAASSLLGAAASLAFAAGSDGSGRRWRCACSAASLWLASICRASNCCRNGTSKP